MGLDIYFKKYHKDADLTSFNEVVNKLDQLENSSYEPNEHESHFKEWLTLMQQTMDLNPRKDIACFRKVNFLLPFFGYKKDCKYLQISKEQVTQLIHNCNIILNSQRSRIKKKKAKQLLPTIDGCYFGNIGYDKWYYDDVRRVRQNFTELLSEIDWEEEIVEMSCWW